MKLEIYKDKTFSDVKDDFWTKSSFLARVFDDKDYRGYRCVFCFNGTNSKGNLEKLYLDCHRWIELKEAFDKFKNLRNQHIIALEIYESPIDMAVMQNQIYEELGYDTLLDVCKDEQAPPKGKFKRIMSKVAQKVSKSSKVEKILIISLSTLLITLIAL